MTDSLPKLSGQEEVRNLLARINEAWRHLPASALPAALASCFAEDVTFRGPAFALLGQGREFAVRSYQDFITFCQVNEFEAAEPAIDISGDTATAHYRWKMTYTMKPQAGNVQAENSASQQYTEEGHDLFVLSRQTGQWLVVWRVLLADPA